MLKISKGLMIGLALLIATSAFAEKASLTIYDAVNIGGKQVKPGDYTVQWDGTGQNVQVSLLRNKSVVVAVPAQLVETSETASNNSYSASTNPDGSRTLNRIQLHGKKYALDFSGEAASAAK